MSVKAQILGCEPYDDLGLCPISQLLAWIAERWRWTSPWYLHLLGGYHSGQVRVLLITAGDEAGAEEIKLSGHVREEGQSKQANQNRSNSENMRCFSFGLNTDDVQRSSEYYY